MLFRITRRLPLILKKVDKHDVKRVLVVGAGTGGVSIVKEIHRHPEINYDVIGVIYDNKSDIRKRISRVKVMGDRNFIKEASYRYA